VRLSTLPTLATLAGSVEQKKKADFPLENPLKISKKSAPELFRGFGLFCFFKYFPNYNDRK
jgi:hypothetical protein